MVEENDVDWVVHRKPLPPDEDNYSGILSVTLVSKLYEGHRDPDKSDNEEEDGFGDFDPNKPLQPYAESNIADENTSESKSEPKALEDMVSSEQVGHC